MRYGLLEPDQVRFRRSSTFSRVDCHRERDAASAPPEAEQRDGLQASAPDYDEFSKTGLCRSTPRTRAVSNSFIELNTSM